MPRFNRDLNFHFKGRRLILETHDPHRDRPLRVFDVEEEGVVGISDGTDAWITPTTMSLCGHDLLKCLKEPILNQPIKVIRRELTQTKIAPRPTSGTDGPKLARRPLHV